MYGFRFWNVVSCALESLLAGEQAAAFLPGAIMNKREEKRESNEIQ